MGHLLWLLVVGVKRVICFFIGHDSHDHYEIGFIVHICDRCYIEYPDDKITIPVLLERCSE